MSGSSLTVQDRVLRRSTISLDCVATRGSSLSSQLGTLQELGESDDRDEDHDEEDARAQKKRGRPSQQVRSGGQRESDRSTGWGLMSSLQPWQEPEDDDDSEGDFSSAKGKVRRKGSPAPGARKVGNRALSVVRGDPSLI